MFASRLEALEYACSIVGDYGSLVKVAVFSPSGKCEIIQQAGHAFV